jgi:hypothetical protein
MEFIAHGVSSTANEDLNHGMPFGDKGPIPRFREHTVMASPLDFWSLIPYFGLIWIAVCLIQLGRSQNDG